MFKKIRSSFKNYIKLEIDRINNALKQEQELVLIQNGRIWSAALPKDKAINIHDAEFKVFSQWGDDGIIAYLVKYLDIKNRTFIEFGVSDYMESNTRFLLINNNWSGVVMDGDRKNIEKIKRQDFYWKHDLSAVHAFITKENINELIKDQGLEGEVGLLHIDLDGNDYWVMKALHIVDPVILIMEYNSMFGYKRPITIPYQADFNWTNAHYSNLYFGASILSLCDLASEKGYDFIGCNTAGNNAYFVKRKYAKDLKSLTAENGFVDAKFRQSRDKDGKLNYLDLKARTEILQGLPVYNTRIEKNELF
ncbi:hypothetical protein ACXYMT_06660 [Salinimicrobium sp. CAU 1759]